MKLLYSHRPVSCPVSSHSYVFCCSRTIAGVSGLCCSREVSLYQASSRRLEPFALELQGR